jgi:hypothetical protein
MKKLCLLICLLFILSACTNYSKKAKYISPIKAIELAAISAPETHSGVFEMIVKAGKSRDSMIFLNSELDYRDQRNLTIALRPAAMKQLAEKYGKDPLEYLLNKRILIKGEAKRMKIWMFYNNKKLTKYYYQTHVFVNSSDQISII